MTLCGLVGPIVGPISDRSAGGVGGTEFVVTDFPYNFAIGGLPFLTNVNSKTPYQRATADFRKQQFDASQNVGDQSLTGFWLRGEFSFHRGAGVRFNDAFDDTVTNSRYFEGVGINPWVPGQVTLSGSWDAQTRNGNSDYMLGGWDAFTPVVYYVSSTDSNLYSTADAVTPISTNPCGGFACDPNPGGTVFYLDAEHILDGTGAYDSDQSDGTNFAGLWWAHGRLVAVDANGLWYTYAATGTGTSQALADAFWNGDGFAGNWSVSDSPGAIFMARGRTIYKLTLNTDGAVPTLAAPAVAAEVPDNETIVSMAYYLGFLVIVTDKGVRIGLTNSNGDVQYGATVVDFVSSTCRSVAAVGSRVYCTGTRDVDPTEQVFIIDLSQPTSDGVFAWTIDTPPPWGADANTGIAYSDGFIFSYSDTTFQETGVPSGNLDAAQTGYLETGFIRLGTMEPKAFHSVRVKTDGTEGSISVSVVRKGGATTLITNLPATRQGDYDVALNMAAPEEYIALRFTLIAGAGGVSPILLGYQVRALPAPSVRARMISVPLMCNDVEKAPDGQTTGYAGWAAQRLFALEEMEKNAGYVTFQDFRTGEVAVVFIEQIAFTGENPGRGVETGFGGVITATLRKVT